MGETITITKQVTNHKWEKQGTAKNGDTITRQQANLKTGTNKVNITGNESYTGTHRVNITGNESYTGTHRVNITGNESYTGTHRVNIRGNQSYTGTHRVNIRGNQSYTVNQSQAESVITIMMWLFKFLEHNISTIPGESAQKALQARWGGI